MSTGPTTLEQELLLAAWNSELLAELGVGKPGAEVKHRADAARLRQRAAWVRELEGSANFKAFNLTGREVLRSLTGPIPAAETAPHPPDTNRCSYCGMMTVADEDGVYCGHEPTCRRAETAPTETPTK